MFRIPHNTNEKQKPGNPESTWKGERSSSLKTRTMETNVNRFEALGHITSVGTSRNGNTFIHMRLHTREGKEIYPTFFLPAGNPIHVESGKKAYISGHVTAFDENQHTPDGHTRHTQRYYADYVYVAHDQTSGKKNSEYFDVYLTGKLVRILDSGHGWKRVAIETTVKERGRDYTTRISVGYFANDRNLIRVSDLKIGATYEIITKPVTPERKKDGRTVIYDNLVAVFAREIIPREDGESGGNGSDSSDAEAPKKTNPEKEKEVVPMTVMPDLELPDEDEL